MADLVGVLVRYLGATPTVHMPEVQHLGMTGSAGVLVHHLGATPSVHMPRERLAVLNLLRRGPWQRLAMSNLLRQDPWRQKRILVRVVVGRNDVAADQPVLLSHM